MNWSIFILALFALLISSIVADDSECQEEQVGLYYIGQNATVFYLPKGDFKRKHKLAIGKEFKPSTLSYNYKLGTLLFLDARQPKSFHFYNVETHDLTRYFLRLANVEPLEVVSDSLTGNFYFISKGNAIFVCSFNKKKCVQIVESTKIKRKNLLLDSKNGKMYWIEGTFVKMSKMNGKDANFLDKSINIDSIGLNVKNNLLYIYFGGMVIQFDLDTLKLDSKSSLAGDNSVLFADCKAFCLDNSNGLLSVHHLNGKNETVDKRTPNTKLQIAPEPFNETMHLENPCKNIKCDNGVCVGLKVSPSLSAECLYNKTFDLVKMNFNKPEIKPRVVYHEKVVPSGLGIGWSILLVLIVVMSLTFLIFVVIKYQLWQKLRGKITGQNDNFPEYASSVGYSKSNTSSALSSINEELNFQFKYRN